MLNKHVSKCFFMTLLFLFIHKGFFSSKKKACIYIYVFNQTIWGFYVYKKDSHSWYKWRLKKLINVNINWCMQHLVFFFIWHLWLYLCGFMLHSLLKNVCFFCSIHTFLFLVIFFGLMHKPEAFVCSHELSCFNLRKNNALKIAFKKYLFLSFMWKVVPICCLVIFYCFYFLFINLFWFRTPRWWVIFFIFFLFFLNGNITLLTSQIYLEVDWH